MLRKCMVPLVLLMMFILSGCQSIDASDILDMFESLDDYDSNVEYEEDVSDYDLEGRGDMFTVTVEDEYVDLSIAEGLVMVNLVIEFEEDRGDLLVYHAYLTYMDYSNALFVRYSGSFDRFYVFEDSDTEDFVKALAALSIDDIVDMLDKLGIDEVND